MGTVQRTRRGPWTSTTVVSVDMFASEGKRDALGCGAEAEDLTSFTPAGNPPFRKPSRDARAISRADPFDGSSASAWTSKACPPGSGLEPTAHIKIDWSMSTCLESELAAARAGVDC